MNDLKEYDFVVYGATGFTGKLVVEYLVEKYSNNLEISWALAGRNLEKLESVAASKNVPEGLFISKGSKAPPFIATSGNICLIAKYIELFVVANTEFIGPMHGREDLERLNISLSFCFFTSRFISNGTFLMPSLST